MTPICSVAENELDSGRQWSRDIQDPTLRRLAAGPPLLFKSTSAHRSNNIDFIRFSLASLVIFSHAYLFIFGTNDSIEPLARMTRNQLNSGTFAVEGFFALSGFLITASWMRSDGFLSYLKKRVLRIHPGFAMAMLLCFVVVAPLGHADLHSLFSARQVLLHGFGNLFLLNGFVEMTAFKTNPQAGLVNGSLWTIRYEFACYLLIPLISLVAVRRRVGALGLLVIVGCLICGVGAYLQTGAEMSDAARQLGNVIGISVRTITFFMAGAMYYFLRDRIRFNITGVGLSVLALLVASRIPNLLAVVAPIAATYLIFWLAFGKFLPFQGFGRFGDFSYGLYLYGCPIQQLLVQRYPHLGMLTHFMIAWPAATAAGALSWYCVERPFMRLKSKPAAKATQTPNLPKQVSALLHSVLTSNNPLTGDGIAA